MPRGDKYALPASLQQRVDSAFLSDSEEPWVSPADLPAPLQKQIETQVDWWQENETSIRSDRLLISTAMSAQFVFPDGVSVEAPFSQNIGRQFLRNVAKPPKTAAQKQKVAALPAPKPMPAALHKRIVVTQIPQDDRAVADLLRLAKRKGFSKVWLQVMLDDSQGATRLHAAVNSAHKVGILVRCAVSLLQDGGLRAPEDVNILGETGDTYAKRKLRADPDFKDEPIRIRYGFGGKPEALAVGFSNTAQDAAKNWRGVALDLARLAPAEALQMLNALPESP